MAENSKKLSVGLLYDDTLDSSDGVANQVKLIGSWLSTQGHHVFYMCGKTHAKTWAGGTIYSLANNIGVRFNGNELSIPFYSSKRAIKDVLALEKPDIIHVTMPYSPFMAQRVIKYADSSTAVVSSFHIYPSSWLTHYGCYVLAFIQHFSLKRLDERLAVSQVAASFAKKTFRYSSTVLPNLVPWQDFAPKHSVKPQSERIVFVGRLVPRKGAKQLIEAVSILVNDYHHNNVEVLIAGKGSDKTKLQQLVKELNLADNIKFLGYIDDDTRSQLLASASVACFPSLYGESFGIVLIEAMAAGSTVVLGGHNPGYETVLGQQPKMLINPKDTLAFARRLDELLKDKKLSDNLHTWQTKQRGKYDIALVGPKLVEAYHRAIAKRNRDEA